MEETAIDKAFRNIEILSVAIGLQRLKNRFKDIKRTRVLASDIDKLCKTLGISSNQKDILYQSTDIETWKVIIDTLYGMIKPFPWLAEFWDCDDRASWILSMCSLLTNLNTCADAYCRVTNINTGATDMHHPNFIIDKDLNAYIFDVDNGGMWQKVTSNSFVMGVWKYDLVNINIF